MNMEHELPACSLPTASSFCKPQMEVCETKEAANFHVRQENEDAIDVRKQELNIKKEEVDIKEELLDTFAEPTGQARDKSMKQFHTCSICDYKSVLKSDLKRHMMTHTGEKPNSCSICEYKAVRKSDIVRHMKRHTGEKPYFCGICEHKASDKSDIVRHMTKHTGKKPYSCSTCEYKASEKGNLNRHIVIMHTGKKRTLIKRVKKRTM